MRVLTWWCNDSADKDCDAIICDGAVRSGKTLCMSISFAAWSFYRFNNASFAFCGKTIQSLRRNVIVPLTAVLRSQGFVCEEKVSRNLIEIRYKGRMNRFYLFGGRDESSAALIQGMTLGGVMFDEAALMPRSFIEQALARCSLGGSKFWFNCNPENPNHWFYKEWICKRKEKNALYIHFVMEDNPSLSREILQRYRQLYSGAFFERFVLGRWVAAQGLVYPMFSEEKNVCREPPERFEEYRVSCDYGTVNPASFGLWGKSGGVWYRLKEYYHDSRKTGVQCTDEEYYEQLEALIGGRKTGMVIVDPSAASFIACIRKHGRFKAVPAKNEVLSGIQRVSQALKNMEIFICAACADTLREFGEYRRESSGTKDCPKKENDHAMDDIRYFVTMTLCDNDSSFFALAAPRE